jgi:tetratricopeptide (TPR) repeat protein
MTEELIAILSRGGRLRVVASTSVRALQERQLEVRQIAESLRVSHVLEGALQKAGSKLRIQVRLVDALDGSTRWSATYDRQLGDIFAVQDDIARAVAGELDVRLAAGSGSGPGRRRYTPSIAAYEWYLQGKHAVLSRSSEGRRQGIEYFTRAIAADPGFALAHVGLSNYYGMTDSIPPVEANVKAKASALRALELDDNLAAAHTSLALIAETYDWDWQRAETEFQRAIALDPNYATGHHWYAEFLGFQGRFAQALEEIDRARSLDPLSLMIAVDRGVILYQARQYDRAMEQFQQVRDMQPDFPRADLIIPVYVEKGMFAEALAIVQDPRRAKDEPGRWATEAWIHGRAGRKAEAQRARQKLELLNERQPVDNRLLAMAYLGTGDKDRAIACIERMLADRSNFATGMKVDPALDPLRDDPRFQELLRRVGLAS